MVSGFELKDSFNLLDFEIKFLHLGIFELKNFQCVRFDFKFLQRVTV